MNTADKIIQELKTAVYERSDLYLIRKWYLPDRQTPAKPDREAEREPLFQNISDDIRQTAYLNFYKRIKPFKVVSRQTIQRWFGIGGFAVPSRRQLLTCALCLHFSLEETEDYLLHGLSQWNLQINDYEEMICMYCLENHLDQESYAFMVHFFETHTDQELRPLQTARTDQLKKSYHDKRTLPMQDFLLWMCHSAELFKGYSMTVYSYYIQLLNEAFHYYQKECQKELQTLLARTSYMEWKNTPSNRLSYPETEKEQIRRYLKNMQRHKNTSIDPRDLKNIQTLYVTAYAPKARISDLLSQIYHNDQKNSATWNHEMFAQLTDFLGDEMQWENSKYVSELLSMSIQKEQQMFFQRTDAALEQLDDGQTCPEWICRQLSERLSSFTYPSQTPPLVKGVRKIVVKELKKQKTRVRNIQRSDLLLLIQYIYSVKYDIEIQNSQTGYQKEAATQGFLSLANTILSTCGMREISADYRLDQLLLSCITDDEIILLGDLLDTSFLEE